MVGYIAIYNEEGLTNIKNDLNNKYVLMADIELTNTNWAPIGNSTNQFTGELEGNYYKISGLNNGNSPNNYQGLFGFIGNEGKISNLNIEGIIQGTSDLGILTGWNEGVLENIKVKGKVISVGTAYHGSIGGVTGYNRGILKKCFSEVNVITNNEKASGLGVLVGINDKMIQDSYSAGSVTGSNWVGGLVGLNTSNGTIENSYTISKVIPLGVAEKVGGLIGDERDGTVTNSYWSPDLAGVETSEGGIALTKEQMKLQESYVGFDFTLESPIWVMKEYPELNYNFGAK